MFHVKHLLANTEAREHPIQNGLRVDNPDNPAQRPDRQAQILDGQLRLGLEQGRVDQIVNAKLKLAAA